MFKRYKVSLMVCAMLALLLMLAGCNKEQSPDAPMEEETSAPPTVSSDETTLQPTVMDHTPLEYAEEDRNLEIQNSDASMTLTYYATIGDSDTKYSRYYVAQEGYESVDELRAKNLDSMDGIKDALPKDGLFTYVEEYVDDYNGVQVYSISDTNLEMYSAAYQLDGSLVVSYVIQWDTYTYAGDVVDFNAVAEKVSLYTGLDISAADLMWAYNDVVSKCVDGGYCQFNFADPAVYRYAMLRVEGFNTDAEIWSLSVVNEFYSVEAEG